MGCSYALIIVCEGIINSALCCGCKSSSVFPSKGVGRTVIVGEGGNLGLPTPTSRRNGGQNNYRNIVKRNTKPHNIGATSEIKQSCLLFFVASMGDALNNAYHKYPVVNNTT